LNFENLAERTCKATRGGSASSRGVIGSLKHFPTTSR
jgi:hypothetical protein